MFNKNKKEILMNSDKNWEDIGVDIVQKEILLITINRAKYKNALRTNTLKEISQALEKNKDIKCTVITGGEEVFAAGADINELASKNSVDALLDIRSTYWQAIKEYKQPLIAAVNGFCLGGGCELALHCDIIIAGENAQFGQPEINLGIIPGAGGTQRLTKIVGKSNAMQMLLTGAFIDAPRALQMQLVSEIVPSCETITRALKIATTITQKSPLAIQNLKKVVLHSYESTLSSGLEYEKMVFSTLLSSEDKQEGVTAFGEKRKPIFKGK